MGKLGRLVAAGISVDDEAQGIWPAEAEVRTGSRLSEAGAGTEAARVEAGAEMLAEAVVSGASSVVTKGDMEVGTETVGTGGEREWQGGEANPVKDSNLRDPSLSTAAERNIVSFCYHLMLSSSDLKAIWMILTSLSFRGLK